MKKSMGKIVVAISISSMLFLSNPSVCFAAETSEDVPVNAQVVGSEPSGKPSLVAVIPSGQDSNAASVRIKISGLEPYSFVEAFVESTPVLIASGFADSVGVFEVVANLPPYLEQGNHKISATLQLLGQVAGRYVLRTFSVTEGGKIGKYSASNAGGSNTGGQNGGNSNGGGAGDPSASPTMQPTPGGQASSIGGVLLAGGLQTKVSQGRGMNSPAMAVSVTIRNTYTRSYDVGAEFSVEGLFGLLVAPPVQIDIKNLRPNETRTVSASFSNIGEWGFYTTKVALTPPSKINNLSLVTKTIQQPTFVWPKWLIFVYILALLAFTVRFFWIRNEALREFTVGRLKKFRGADKKMGDLE